MGACGPENGYRFAVLIEACESAAPPAGLRLREALLPDCAQAEHLAEMNSFVAQPERYAIGLKE